MERQAEQKVLLDFKRSTLRGFPVYREELIKGTISDEIVSLISVLYIKH